jgi:hypothetical protein
MRSNFFSSASLVKNPIEFGEPEFDHVFISAKAKATPGGWRLDIDDDCPVIALDEETKEKFGLDCPTVKEVREGKHKDLTLVSAGSFIWIEEMGVKRLYLLRRDLTAPSDRGLLTGPAGRCDKLIMQTLAEETNEELLIAIKQKQKELGAFTVVTFWTDQESSFNNRALPIKLNQLSEFCEELRQTNPREFWVMDHYKISEVMQKTGPRYKVETYVKCELAEEIEVNIAFRDEANHTLEIRNILELKVPEHSELALIRDGEKLNREVVSFASLQEIPLDKTVPTLRHYIIRSDATSPVELLR